MTPVFLFSLPRSGSTLMQRLLTRQPDIATSSEPWTLLPLYLAFHEAGQYGDHDQMMLVHAMEDFRERLPGGQADYDEAVRAFAETVYGKLCGRGERYFLDKTPRYAMIVDDIVRAFPDSPIIFLWRHPVAIVQSINDTWSVNGEWMVFNTYIDLFKGLDNLVRVAREVGARALVVRYEDLIADPTGEMARAFNYLDLDPDAVSGSLALPENLQGRLGDPKRFGDSGVVRQRSGDWRVTPITPMRRRWLRRYLQWIGDERMAAMGYSLSASLSDLDRVPVTWSGNTNDIVRMAYGYLYRKLNLPILKAKFGGGDDKFPLSVQK